MENDSQGNEDMTQRLSDYHATPPEKWTNIVIINMSESLLKPESMLDCFCIPPTALP